MSSNLRDYVIDIKGKSKETRLQPISPLEALGEKVHTITKSQVVGKALKDLPKDVSTKVQTGDRHREWIKVTTGVIDFLSRCTLRYANSYGATYKIDPTHALRITSNKNRHFYLDSYEKLLDLVIEDYQELKPQEHPMSDSSTPKYLDRKPKAGDYAERVKAAIDCMPIGFISKVINHRNDIRFLDQRGEPRDLFADRFKVINPDHPSHPNYQEPKLEIKPGTHWERLKHHTIDHPKGEIIVVDSATGLSVRWTHPTSGNCYRAHKDFLDNFKPRPDLDTPTDKRNLAFYKESGEPWTEDELDTVRNYCGDTCSRFVMHSSTTKRKYVYWNEDAKYDLKVYPWNNQDKPKQLKQVSYESLFIETQQDSTSNEFSIGDLICYNQEARDTLLSAKGTLPNEIIGEVTKVTDRTKSGSTPLLEYKNIHGKIDTVDSGWVTKYVATSIKNQTTKPKSKPVAQPEPIQSITKETFMSKLKAVASTTVDQNKQALVIASKMEAGRIINKQVLKQLTPHLPFFLQGYAKSPFAPFVAANLVAMVANHTGNSKLTKVSDLMLLGAADSGVAAFNLDKIVDDILSNIKLPAGVLDDSDE